MNSYTLEEGRQKAAGAGGRREEKIRRDKVFLSRSYPDMILRRDSTYGKGECHSPLQMVV
ncbi:MAG: hypothetical protein F6K39_48530 [Okeania sp. SIO3B3]|nr:hypothetical protein [Okeania sp. SIO3B3]